ncbi:MAG TPA: hypothetical protein VIX91_07060 [Candidatus Acidoferrum sp.]
MRGPRTLTRFNETKEKNNRLGRLAPKNRALALVVDLGSTITAGLIEGFGIAEN